MSSEPKEKLSLDEIARGFESLRTKGEDGEIAFGGFKFDDLETVFFTSIKWDESLSEYERERIAFKAPFKAGEAGKITAKTLLSALGELEKEILSAKPTDFIVVFSISLRYRPFLTSIKVDDAQIEFFQTLPKEIDRTPIRHPLHLGDLVEIPDNYSVVTVKVSSKTIYAAYVRALTALEVLRGIWNGNINSKTDMTLRIGGTRDFKPINKIRLGPVHTVHLPDGSLATKEWWYQSRFEAGDVEDLTNEWEIFQNNSSFFLDRYHALPYKQQATDMWIRYVNAFDHTDRDATFLQLWSLLELLTGTNGERYDETIRRTLFICEEREFHRLILEHLRDRRNAQVHQADGSSKVEQHVYQLKRYVEELLRLHHACCGRFKNMAEIGEFLSLPDNPAVLRERRRLYGQALVFRQRTLAQK